MAPRKKAAKRKSAAKKQKPKRSGRGTVGRPHALDRPIQLPGGGTTTLSRAICNAVQTGVSLATAARAHGTTHQTVLNWRGEGSRLASLRLEGRLPDKLTAYEDACLTFFDDLERAGASGMTLMAGRLVQLAQGGSRRIEEVLYDADGNETGRKVRTEQLPPDRAAIVAWLERRHPQEWARAERLDVGPAAGEPVAQTSPYERLASELAEMARRSSEARAQLRAVEEPEPPEGGAEATG